MPDTTPTPLTAILDAILAAADDAKRAHDQMCDLAETLLPDPQPAPQPPAVDPADVRVGDRVRVVTTWEVSITEVQDIALGGAMDDGESVWIDTRDDDAVFYLIDRPEPEDPRVAVVEEWVTDSDAGARDLLARLDAMGADQ